jgi:ubiquinone/menaquinone biosynthesis C-methylase UbiE
MTAGSWEDIAIWWDEQVGEWGDYYHQHLILPALLRALGELTGLSVVDLGCGNGASSRWLARAGADVIGVEVSPAMVERARAWEERTPLGIEYLVSDAAHAPSLPDASADRVVANMVLHDMEDAAGFFREASRLLRRSGRLVASLLHPCFESVDGSSWLVETIEVETRVSKRICRYLEPYSAPGVAKPDQPQPHTYYHRPLSSYCERLVEAGLVIDCLAEPLPDETFKAERPESYQRHATVPFVLVLGASKLD